MDHDNWRCHGILPGWFLTATAQCFVATALTVLTNRDDGGILTENELAYTGVTILDLRLRFISLF
jgi:hypothetical protein